MVSPAQNQAKAVKGAVAAGLQVAAVHQPDPEADLEAD